jgi:hypothetical protein
LLIQVKTMKRSLADARPKRTSSAFSASISSSVLPQPHSVTTRAAGVRVASSFRRRAVKVRLIGSLRPRPPTYEHGLEQEFNSLENQREAAEAYVKSQAHEGWRALSARYDDGGFSGGSMDRPALQRLLADIRAGLVDVVVVYKVDRLTRSLSDFAKLVELFDAHGVSWVRVAFALDCCDRKAKSYVATTGGIGGEFHGSLGVRE